MKVRIRLQQGQRIQRKPGKNRKLASAFGALMVPVSLMAYVLGFWRLAADIGVAGEFAISGTFSHWQVWIGIGAALSLSSYSLGRYGRGGDLEVPRVLTLPMFPGRPDHPPSDEPKLRAKRASTMQR